MAKKRALGRGLNALLASTQLGPVPTTVGVMEESEESLAPATHVLLDQAISEGRNPTGNTASEVSVSHVSEDASVDVAESRKETLSQENHQTSFSYPSGELKYLPIEYIKRGAFQPRRDFDPSALEELAQSIRQQGLMQPIVVRALAKNTYEIIAGERRWRACQLAGLDALPCLVKSVDDETALALALIENMQREDLNPMEEALGLHRLHAEFDLTHQQVADVVGKSRSAVTNLLRLINLQSDVKVLLERGDLDMGHARALLSLPASIQLQAAKTAVARGLTVRHMEAYVRSLLASPEKKSPIETRDPNVRDLETRLSERLGAKVLIQHSAQGKGKGKVIIRYTSLAELDGIIDHIADTSIT